MTDFTAQLGRADHPGLLTAEQRLERIEPGRNPYVTGASLAPDSLVFFGREQALAEALGVLRRPDKPGNVSVLGERRFGKSSFLNRIYGALAAEPGLVSIRATTQDFSGACPERFFHGLYQSILDALDGSTGDGSTGQESDRGEVRDYPGLRDFIRRLARKKDLRFVLLLDEFERITGGQAFKADFFSNLRALGERPEYRFGYLIASRRPLKALCREQRIEESAFWNIFGTTLYMGLLTEPAARNLVTEPLRHSLPPTRWPDPAYLWTQEVAPLTGRHPALIQILLAPRWNAWHGGFRHNQDRIDQTLHDHLEDLWFNRHGKEEWRVLIQVVKGEPPTADPILQDLRLRGLVTADNRPFSPRFERLIPDLMPEGVSIEKAVERFRKGGEVASGLLEALKELARISGYLVGSL